MRSVLSNKEKNEVLDHNIRWMHFLFASHEEKHALILSVFPDINPQGGYYSWAYDRVLDMKTHKNKTIENARVS